MNSILYFAQSTTQYLSDEELAAQMFAFWAIFLPILLLSIAVGYVLGGILYGRIFRKAGLAQWPAWVPFYNTWKFFEIGGQHGALSLIALLPFVNIVSSVFYCIAAYHVGLKLQKDGVFVLLAIFLPIVWLIWLAVDSSTWDESRSTAPSRATGPLPTTQA